MNFIEGFINRRFGILIFTTKKAQNLYKFQASFFKFQKILINEKPYLCLNIVFIFEKQKIMKNFWHFLNGTAKSLYKGMNLKALSIFQVH